MAASFARPGGFFSGALTFGGELGGESRFRTRVCDGQHCGRVSLLLSPRPCVLFCRGYGASGPVCFRALWEGKFVAAVGDCGLGEDDRFY